MRLSAPKSIVFLISVILIVVGLLISLNVAGLGSIGYSNWISFAGGALLSLGCFLKGL